MFFIWAFPAPLNGFRLICLPARDCCIFPLLPSACLTNFPVAPTLPGFSRLWGLAPGVILFSRSPLTASPKNNLPRKFRGKCVFVVFQTCCIRVSTGKICCAEKQLNDNDSAERMAQTGMEFLWIIEEVRTNQETLKQKINNVNYLYESRKATWFSAFWAGIISYL